MSANHHAVLYIPHLLPCLCSRVCALLLLCRRLYLLDAVFHVHRVCCCDGSSASSAAATRWTRRAAFMLTGSRATAARAQRAGADAAATRCGRPTPAALRAHWRVRSCVSLTGAPLLSRHRTQAFHAPRAFAARAASSARCARRARSAAHSSPSHNTRFAAHRHRIRSRRAAQRARLFVCCAPTRTAPRQAWQNMALLRVRRMAAAAHATILAGLSVIYFALYGLARACCASRFTGWDDCWTYLPRTLFGSLTPVRCLHTGYTLPLPARGNARWFRIPPVPLPCGTLSRVFAHCDLLRLFSPLFTRCGSLRRAHSVLAGIYTSPPLVDWFVRIAYDGAHHPATLF